MSHQAHKTDRRIQRTRQLLRDALMQLIVTSEDEGGKSYDAITIQDITDQANVARTTFYLHYGDKDELLFEGMREIYDGLFNDDAWAFDDPTKLMEQLTDPADFAHVAQHAAFYRVMLSEKGSASFFIRVQRYLAQRFQQDVLQTLVDQYQWQPNLPLDMVASALAGTYIAMIEWWLDHNMERTPDEMARFVWGYGFKGLAYALGIPAEQRTLFDPEATNESIG